LYTFLFLLANVEIHVKSRHDRSVEFKLKQKLHP
jgi:hypothetical protein